MAKVETFAYEMRAWNARRRTQGMALDKDDCLPFAVRGEEACALLGYVGAPACASFGLLASLVGFTPNRYAVLRHIVGLDPVASTGKERLWR